MASIVNPLTQFRGSEINIIHRKKKIKLLSTTRSRAKGKKEITKAKMYLAEIGSIPS